MTDTDYFAARAQQELKAAIAATDPGVREVHLQLADAYGFRVRELKAIERRSQLRLLETA